MNPVIHSEVAIQANSSELAAGAPPAAARRGGIAIGSIAAATPEETPRKSARRESGWFTDNPPASSRPSIATNYRQRLHNPCGPQVDQPVYRRSQQLRSSRCRRCNIATVARPFALANNMRAKATNCNARRARLPSAATPSRPPLAGLGCGPLHRAGRAAEARRGCGLDDRRRRSTKTPRARCADARRLAEGQHRRDAGIGAFEQRGPLVAGLASRKSPPARLQRRPAARSVCVAKSASSTGRAVEQGGVELRLDRADAT